MAGFLGLVCVLCFLFSVLATGLLGYRGLGDPYNLVTINLILGACLAVAFVVQGGLHLFKQVSIRRAAGFGSGLLIYSAVFLIFLVLVNYLVYRTNPFVYDSTEQKIHTLAPETRSLLDNLESPVVIRAFYAGGQITSSALKALLDRIERYSDNLSVRVLDTVKKPSLIRKFGISEDATLHFSFEDPSIERHTSISRKIDEQSIANALKKLGRATGKKVYVLQGHGEVKLSEASEGGISKFAQAIVGENLEVSELSLVADNRVPEDAAAVILLTPERDYLDKEMIALQRFMARGGGILMFAEPKVPESFKTLAQVYGIKIDSAVIVEPVMRAFQGQALEMNVVFSTYVQHPIIEGFDRGDRRVLFTVSTAVDKSNVTPADGEASQLVLSSEVAWGEKNIKQIFSDQPQAAKEPDDLLGPVSVAAVYEGKGEQKAARLVVFGDMDFVKNQRLNMVFNRDFALNALNWVVGNSDKISIRSRTMRKSLSRLSQSQFSAIFSVSALIIPQLIVIWGLWVWWKRRVR